MKFFKKNTVLLLIASFLGIGLAYAFNVSATTTFYDFDSYSPSTKIPQCSSSNIDGWCTPFDNRYLYFNNNQSYSSPISVENQYYLANLTNINYASGFGTSGYTAFSLYADYGSNTTGDIFGFWGQYNHEGVSGGTGPFWTLRINGSQVESNFLNRSSFTYSLSDTVIKSQWSHWIISWNKITDGYYDLDVYLNDIQIQNYVYIGDFIDYSFGAISWQFPYYTYHTYIDDLTISTSGSYSPPLPVDAVCGTDNGGSFAYPTEPSNYCSVGSLSGSVSFDGSGWDWTCAGIYGGSDASCSATNTAEMDAVCGSANGGSFSSSSEIWGNECSVGNLIFPSFVETSSGWSWICSGINGGDQISCSAFNSGVVYPDTPTLEDCSSYSFPNNWICEINNTIKSAFLPSQSKLNDLNLAINSFQQKAPFNYLTQASNSLNSLKNGISEGDLSITILDNTSTINLGDLDALSGAIKTFFTIMVVLAFLFWGIKYISNFFK